LAYLWGDSVAAPVTVIANAESKTLQEIADEVVNRAPEIRSEDTKFLRSLCRWGKVVPLGFLRRWLLRVVLNQPRFVRKRVGTFQVTTLRHVDIGVSLAVTAGAILGVGRVRDRAENKKFALRHSSHALRITSYGMAQELIRS
jgi:hypothetical protein